MAEDGIDRRTLSRAIKRFDPAWELRRAERVGTGALAVYRIEVEAPRTEPTWYLKATPGSDNDRISTEARLLALLADTGIPVPAVRGLIDDDPALPTPLALLHEQPGRTVERTGLSALDDETLGTLAYQSGEHLAALHDLDVVDRFGYLEPRGPSCDGDVPSGDAAAIGVADPRERWRERLRADLEPVVDGLDASAVDVLPAEIDTALDRQIAALDGPFTPVLARIDQAIENLRLLGNRIVGVLDWEFTLAATPGYDLEYVAWSLAGGPYLYGTELPDRRELVRERLLAGYTDADGPGDPDQARANRSCYALVITVRAIDLLEEWYELFAFDLPRERAAERLRAEYDATLS